MSVARFIDDQRTNHRVPHTLTCLLLGGSLAWFYEWHARATGPSAANGVHTNRDRPERSEKCLYPVPVSLQSVLDMISPRSNWARRLHALLSDRPRMNLVGMGVPDGWADDKFWTRHPV